MCGPLFFGRVLSTSLLGVLSNQNVWQVKSDPCSFGPRSALIVLGHINIITSEGLAHTQAQLPRNYLIRPLPVAMYVSCTLNVNHTKEY